MQTKYRSKIGGFIVVVYICILVPLAVFIYWRDVPPIIIFTFVGLFIPYLYLTTSYIIRDDKFLILRISFIEQSVPISSIRSITPSTTLLSAPAFSVAGRLLISYGKYDTMIISPVRTQEFCARLKAINPNIELRL